MHRHEALIHRWFDDLFTRGEIDVLADLVTDDFRSFDSSGNKGATLDGFKEWFRWYRSAFVDPAWTLHDIVMQGDLAAVRYSGHTTYRGGFFDLPASGQRVPETGMLLFRFRDGKISELYAALSDLDAVFAMGGKIVPAETL